MENPWRKDSRVGYGLTRADLIMGVGAGEGASRRPWQLQTELWGEWQRGRKALQIEKRPMAMITSGEGLACEGVSAQPRSAGSRHPPGEHLRPSAEDAEPILKGPYQFLCQQFGGPDFTIPVLPWFELKHERVSHFIAYCVSIICSFYMSLGDFQCSEAILV